MGRARYGAGESFGQDVSRADWRGGRRFLLEKLEAGVVDGEEKLKAKRVMLLRAGEKNSWLEIVLDEGKEPADSPNAGSMWSGSTAVDSCGDWGRWRWAI